MIEITRHEDLKRQNSYDNNWHSLNLGPMSIGKGALPSHTQKYHMHSADDNVYKEVPRKSHGLTTHCNANEHIRFKQGHVPAPYCQSRVPVRCSGKLLNPGLVVGHIGEDNMLGPGGEP